MNIRVFNIRLSKEFCIVDQNRMNKFLDTVEVKLSSTNFVTNGTVDYWSAVVFFEPKKFAENKKSIPFSIDDLTMEEQTIFNALKIWRNNIAEKLSLPSYVICHNSHLANIAKEKPTTLDNLGKVTGFGATRAEKYGDAIIAVLNVM